MVHNKPNLLRIWYDTHVGKKREKNEDSLLVETKLGLFAVADGMGGHPKGEVASYMATHLLKDIFEKHIHEVEAIRKDVFETPLHPGMPKKGVEVLKIHLRETLSVINKYILKAGNDLPDAKGMGTTLSALWFLASYVFIMHTGDSRIYRYRNSQLTRLTHDHAKNGYLVGGLGPSEVIKGEVHEHERISGDRYLICSDGVYNHLQDHELTLIVGSPQPETVIPKIMYECLKRGGLDNITAILIVDGTPEPNKINLKNIIVRYGGPF